MKAIKRSLAIILLLLSSNIIHAQCDLSKDEKDQFSGQRTREGSENIGQRNYHWKLMFKRTGDVYQIGLTIRWGTNIDQPFSKETPILLKLQSGDIITIRPDADAPPQQEVTDVQIITSFYPMGTVTRAEYKLLKKSPIVALRTKMVGKDFDLEKITDKQTGKIMDLVACMLQNE